MYPKNNKTAKPIEPKFCQDPREDLPMLRITKSCIQKLLIFVKFKKCANEYLKIRELFCYCFLLYKRKTLIVLTKRATIKS